MKPLNEYADMRAVYADTLVELADQGKPVVVLEADLMAATGTKPFLQAYPERHVNAGIAEANMIGVASGLSASGFIPFANTFGCFASRRAYDQFFLSANYAKRNVKLVGTDPGVTAKFNGGTHMPFVDTALMNVVPKLTVVEPSDTVSVYKITSQLAEMYGCSYMRLHRKGAVTLYSEDQEITIGKGIVTEDGTDVTLIATGMVMVPEAKKAAEELKKEGISTAVIDMHTVKPLDKELVLKYAEKTGAIVTCENAQRMGGLGSAVADYLAEVKPTLVKRIGVDDEFGEVGTQDYLQERYGLTAAKIVDAAKELIKKK